MKTTLSLIALFLFLSVQLYAEKYYWVGGTGNWSELEHWSPESGGTTIHHGVIPTYNDTVYFDENSFSQSGQTVTIDVEHAICMRMDWTNVQFLPTLASSGGNNLSIYGSFLLSPNMNFTFEGKIYFESSSGVKELKTFGKNLNSNLFFNGMDGNWQVDELKTKGDINLNGLDSRLELHGNLSTNRFVFINTGTFVCENKTITADRFMAASGLDKELFIDNSQFDLGSRWQVGSESIVLHNSNTIITLLASRATFYAGENNSYTQINFNAQAGEVRYSGTNCTIDKAIAKAGMKVTGNNNVFTFLSIALNANFEGNNTFGKLWLSPKMNYKFQSEKTQTILTELIASGECSGFSHLFSSASAKAIISKATENVTLTNVLIENIQATGGAVFTANSSAELKENPGWTINENPRTLYWVGGMGEWDNPEHWSLTSGGIGGECLPFHIDHVIFNDNSFPVGDETVDVNTEKAYCKDLLWQTTAGNPTFYSNKQKLRIFGSLQLSESMNFDIGGETKFLSEETGKVIKTSGKQFLNNVLFQGIGGEWSLLDSLNCGYFDIELQHGIVNTNDFNVFCNRLTSSNANERALSLGSSIVTIYDYWKTSSSSNFTFNCGTSLIKLTSAAANLYGGNKLKYYNILFTEKIGKGTVDSDSCNYNKTIFRGNGNLIGTNFYDTLELTAAKVYYLDFFGEQNINTLIGEGSCSGYIILNSSISGTPAKITKKAGAITMDYLILKDIDASNVVDGFYANNSIDMGNNMGCSIISPQGTDLFWVGGNGYWADEANWSYASGGSGGACIPSPADNVFFDANSFSANLQTVFVDMEKAFCNNMDWTGSSNSPTIRNVGTSTLTIYASLRLIREMDWKYNGNVVFESELEVSQITSAGNTFQRDVSFKGTGGLWNLNDSISVLGAVNLVSGTLQTNDYTLNAGFFFSTSSFPSVFEADNSEINISSKWEVRSNFTLGEGDFVVRMDGILPKMTNSCTDDLVFNDVYISNSSSFTPKSYITGTTKTGFKNIYFLGAGELTGSGVKTADTIIFEKDGKLADTNFATKVICKTYGQIWDNATIDTLRLLTSGDITGKNNIKHLIVEEDLLVNDKNVFGYCKINGNADVYGSNIFDTLVFSPDKRYEFQGGKTQKILKEFTIRGNNCRHIYFLSTNNEKATVYKPEGSVRGDFLEMQNITSSGEASFYAGNFNHSDNIDNSCTGWIFEDEPGYIYGLAQDTILIKDEIAILSTENMNGDNYTTYTWNTGAETPNLEVSEAGLYTATANYGMVNGFVCTYSDDIIVHFANLHTPHCFGESSGEIEIISDDTDKYDFLWQDNSTLNSLNNLPKGEYSVEVTEKTSGRKASRTLNLSDGFDLELSKTIKQITCHASNNGNISVNLLNGVEPYTYQWTNYENAENRELQNLPVGEYHLEYSDAHCTKYDTVTITEPEELTIDFETKTSCSDSNGGEIIAHVSGGSPNYTYEWENYSSLNDSILTTLSGEQTYYLTVIDAQSCQTNKQSVLLSQPEAFNVSISELKNEFCEGENNGYIKLAISGGSPTYNYLLNNEKVSLSNNLLEVEIGNHSIEITDKNNCTKQLDFEIKPAETVEISMQSFDAKCGLPTGRIEYNIFSNRTINDINWTNSHKNTISSLENLSKNWYFVSFKDEENCIYTDSIEVLATDCNSVLEVPNIFTPNNDGINDLFQVNAKNLFAFSAIIVNRWGRKVFTWNDYSTGWNGKLNGVGSDLSSGVYYYVIKALGEDGSRFDLKGHFYLER